ncbi:MAG: hypothetical protein K0S35_3699 [Geminicoccaceae bacterium]|nr:hypothetical protein [Geminicoccaceae bacterium]
MRRSEIGIAAAAGLALLVLTACGQSMEERAATGGLGGAAAGAGPPARPEVRCWTRAWTRRSTRRPTEVRGLLWQVF